MKFEELRAINVSEHKENKNGLAYLSWACAWDYIVRNSESATYEIWKDPATHAPYFYDANLGYMVYTTMTIDGVTHEMWLPVMDNKNNAMKAEKYKVKNGRYDVDVEPATMTNINKSIMRCLVKNIAMFGLGLALYAGEDLPDEVDAEANAVAKEKISKVKADALKKRLEQADADALKAINVSMGTIKAKYGVDSLADLNEGQYMELHLILNKAKL